jgi:protein YIPF5/7
VSSILRKTRCILTGRLNQEVLRDLDLGGPLILAILLGFIHLLMGKLHFGVILGWTIVASLAISWVASMIAGPTVRSVDLYSCSCLLGYCMMPMVVFSAVALFLRRGTALAACGGFFTLWCARLAGKTFGIIAKDLQEHYWLLFYPCVLYYGSFALISVY